MTGCIDKRSSSELSEAINSMFRWYAEAGVCYAYLSDVEKKSSSDNSEVWVHFRRSRWFTRGWTLQELVSPKVVRFYDRTWNFIGEKFQMLTMLTQITRIHKHVLKDRRALRSASVAERMSWAAHRTTSRIEDLAYSLLGIFDVNMPMLHGGKNVSG